MQAPDVTHVPGMDDIESRMGVRPIEELLAERATLVESVAELRARHAGYGTWDSYRKARLSAIRMEIRAQAVEAGVKKTEAQLDEEAHADSRYIKMITEATEDRARLVVLDDKIRAIEDRILRANAVARYLASEARL